MQKISTCSQLSVKPIKRNGFALVSSMMIMFLLMLVAMAMLSLSSSTITTSSSGKQLAEARANARMALMLAIGELQMYSGPDTRITAPANIIETDAPPLTGVWKSWEGTNHDSEGRPIRPDYSVKIKSESSSGRFLTWLVSGAEPTQEPLSPAPSTLVLSAPTADTIPLLAEGSLGSLTGQVHVTPQLVNNGTGAIGWWVSPENQKARLSNPYDARTDSAAGLAEKWQSHAAPNPEMFGLSDLLTDPEDYDAETGRARKAISLKGTELLKDNNTTEPQKRFHDFSTSAIGLLTNSATGGWRKDMSILTEKWDDIYASYSSRALPLFRYSPVAGMTSSVEKPSLSDYEPSQCTLYPWSEYSVILGDRWPNTLHAAAASWQSLVSYATSYKNFTYSNGAAESPFVWDPIMKIGWGGRSPTNAEFYNYKHKQRLYPQIARFQFLVYVKAVEDPNRMGRTPTRYQLKLVYVPIFTLWNPYNIRLSIDNPGVPTQGVVIGCRRSIPGALAIRPKVWNPDPSTITGNHFRMFSNGNFQFLDRSGNFWNRYDNYIQENIDRFNPGATRANTWVDMRTMGANLPTGGQLVFEPGEVIMFSPDGRIDTRFGGTSFGMENGYRPELVEGREINSSSNLTADREYWFAMRDDVFTQPFFNRNPGRGFSLSYGIATGGSYTQGQLYSGVGNEYHNLTALMDGALAERYWPRDPNDQMVVGYSVGEIASVPAIPLFSMSMGPRFTLGTGAGAAENRPTKGMVQNDPLASMTIMEPGVAGKESHPVNGTFDMTYHMLSLGTTLTPNLSNKKGFIATGYQSGDGLSNLITHEIPLRPMASLVELLGWNPRGHNPYPPFQSNLIGNSDATPLIPSDSILPTTLNPNSNALNLQHDDAYCANHLLFDDFFLSSIAPRPVNFGGNIDKDIETVYRDFLRGSAPLANRAYRPISADTGLSDSQVTSLVNDVLNSSDGDGFLKIASRLEVDGMFNVNSTSVDAWKALLGHAKGMSELAYYSDAGIDTFTPDSSRPHPITRGPIAAGIEAGSDATTGSPVKPSEFTGFRSLTDDQIEDLAEKIVEQVRLRGPFLSLSEFVNRQLSTNTDLALAGAVQTAINNLETDPMAILRDPTNALSDNTMAVNDPLVADAGYEFNEAAEGGSAYGAPGWLRQAEVLRPLAPILSARDDTFTIRAYGDSRDVSGNIVASAWCEATVSRQRSFIDGSDAADQVDAPTNPINVTYGRKYQIISFRWLHPDEV